MSQGRFQTAAEIIAFAIGRETEAAESYGMMAGRARTPGLKELLLELRREEESHRRLLEGLTVDVIGGLSMAAVPDLGLVDRLADEKLSEDMSLQDLLIFAARKEAQAVTLYESLARMAEAAGHAQVFRFLAGQERNHKLKLETEYEKQLLPEN